MIRYDLIGSNLVMKVGVPPLPQPWWYAVLILYTTLYTKVYAICYILYATPEDILYTPSTIFIDYSSIILLIMYLLLRRRGIINDMNYYELRIKFGALLRLPQQRKLMNVSHRPTD